MHISQTPKLPGFASCSLLPPRLCCARSLPQHLASWNIASFHCHASVIYCVWASLWSKKGILHFHTWHIRSHKSKSLKSNSRASWLRVKLQIWFTQFELGETRSVEDNVIGKLTFLPLECTDTCGTLVERGGMESLNLGVDWEGADDVNDWLTWDCFRKIWVGKLLTAFLIMRSQQGKGWDQRCAWGRDILVETEVQRWSGLDLDTNELGNLMQGHISGS